MPNFVWMVKDADGKRRVRQVNAATVEESKQVLLAAGCTELELREDEIIAAAMEGMEKPEMFGEVVDVTARERARHYGKPPATYGRALRESLWGMKWWFALLAGMGGLRIYMASRGLQPPDRLAVWMVAIVAVIVGWTVFRTWVSLPGIYYAQLNKAKEWHRWDEVLALVEKLVASNQSHWIKIPTTELARNWAHVAVGKGHLEAALKEYSKYEGQPGLPGWLYKSFVAGLHDTARQRDKAVEWTRMAIAEKPDATALHVDLLHRLLYFKRDTTGAREILSEIEKGTLPSAGKPYVARCKGMLAYLEGDMATACREFESARALLEQARHQPFWDASMALTRASLCCALARQGEMARAKEEFAAAREYLEATEQTEMLEECRKVLGNG